MQQHTNTSQQILADLKEAIGWQTDQIEQLLTMPLKSKHGLTFIVFLGVLCITPQCSEGIQT